MSAFDPLRTFRVEEGDLTARERSELTAELSAIERILGPCRRPCAGPQGRGMSMEPFGCPPGEQAASLIGISASATAALCSDWGPLA